MKVERDFIGKLRMKPEVRAAEDALQAMVDAGQAASIGRVHATVMHKHIEKWATRGLKRSGARRMPDPIALLGKRSDPYRRFGAPWADHSSMWNKDGKPYAFITQPYGLTTDGVLHLAKYIESDFDVRVDAGLSWHYPGSTLVIRIQNKGTPYRWES